MLPELDPNIVEQFLAPDLLDDLLIAITKQHEQLSANNEVVIVQGCPINKPYAAELNFSIATSLGAAIVFVTTLEPGLEKSLRELKIVSNPYQHRYKQTIIGFIAHPNSDLELSLIEKHMDLFDLKLPLINDSNNNIDFASIKNFLDHPITTPLTPATFKYHLIEKARGANKKIVLPEGEEPRTIEAANICALQGIAQCILLGDENKILSTCDTLKITLNEKIEIINPKRVAEKYVAPLCEVRKSKGLSVEEARKQLEDQVMVGTMMLHLDEVDGLVSGAIHTTANTIRPAFQIIKTPPDVKLVSSVFFMCLPEQVLVFGDCAINPNPTPEELADIAIQSAKSAASFHITPKIAMLSYSTGTSGFGPSVDNTIAATSIVKTLRPDLEIEGPIQYDTAVSEETARIKLPDSKVAGHANVFIMPDLNVGNISYKMVQRNTGIVCVGPMLQGLRKPVNDLSRGCSVTDIVFTIAITAVQALDKQ
ncbi:MAG: phosphate acetyltransferase [Gammaproteobacteria bacterium]|nr:phosphate acetyltransferase [Gammaproteobacteria bacterium]